MSSRETTNEFSDLSSAKTLTGLQARMRAGIFSRLEKIRDARLTVSDANGTESFGKANDSTIATLDASIQVLDPSFYNDIVSNGALGAAEAYMQGKWITPDLTAALSIFVRNRSVMLELDGGLTSLLKPVRRVGHWANRNTVKSSKKNIIAHYDLGEDMFKLFLDPTMSYSATIYEHEHTSLEESALHKLDVICRKLQLNENDHVVEIGTGWGGFAIYAAKNYGCKVTTTTISPNQLEVAKRRVKAAGLEDKVTLLEQDYRLLEGKFDKLVSVEMIEAVGLDFLDTFFAKCSSLVKPEGRMLIQAITIADRNHEHAAKAVDFIQKYIFPGGALPSMGAIMNSVSGHTDMQISGLQDIGQHYARTLRDWRSGFFDNIEDIRKLGYPNEFIRMWDYYLSYCESGFMERSISTMQLVFDKPECRLTLP